jgi:RNA-splicing ligase RtcB
MQEYQAAMEGIYTITLTPNTLDEAPAAYKPMEEIIQNMQDTVEIVKIIRPVYNFKAAED